ncbi:DUF916 domain-containing protein, partial [Candidatus Peregrinibacteria bacterium]|nr:DUF916 domain-containing protein [Candidatus Peregrinibacteria bacterium]
LALFMTFLPASTLASKNVIMSLKNPDPYTENRSWYQFEEPAGGIATDTIVLNNTSDKEVEVKLYAADATNNDAGSFIIKSAQEEQYGIGKWTKIEQNQINLEPNESKEIDFLISIPDEIAPGQYFGGIIKEELNGECTKNPADCKQQIHVKTRTGNRIYLTIPGEVIEDVKVTDFDHQISDKNQVRFKFKIENHGNMAYVPNVNITIYDLNGNIIETINKEIGKSLPDSSINPTVDWNHQGRFGSFNAKIKVYFEEINQGRMGNLKGSAKFEEFSLNIILLPWIWINSTLLIFAILIGYLFYQRIKIHRLSLNSDFYTVEENETLEEIAEKNKIAWKILAKINHIKAPYSVKKGEKIKIPKSKNES